MNVANNNSFLNNVACNDGNVGILLFAGSGDQVKGNATNGNGQDKMLYVQGLMPPSLMRCS